MADKELIFKIGFDLEAGVKEAVKDSDKALNSIEEALAKNPVIVKMRLDQQSRLSGQVQSESKKAASALSGLKKEMAEINRQWNTLTASERGGEVGAKLIAQYRALSVEAKGYMTTLSAAVKLEDKLVRERERSANAAALYYIFNLHQTTTASYDKVLKTCCIISLIYIKPQRRVSNPVWLRCCIISLIYIKPQLPSGRILTRRVVLYL